MAIQAEALKQELQSDEDWSTLARAEGIWLEVMVSKDKTE